VPLTPAAPAALTARAPAAAQPTAVKPAAERPRPAAKGPAPPTRTIEPGDLICGQCGEGNNPSRKFCRRCGTTLVAAVVAPPLPWWKRIFHGKKKVVAAGERPGRQGGARAGAQGPSVVGRIFKLLVALIVAAAAIGAVGPWRSTLLHRGKSLFTSARKNVAPSFNLVTPLGAAAGSTLAGHPANLLIDEIKTTYWAAAPSPTGGVGQFIGITFALPKQPAVNLDRINFFSGVADNFASQPRPSEVLVAYDNGQSDDLTLKNQPDVQALTLNHGQAVRGLEIIIKGVYPSSSGGQSVAISEIEFNTKS
jgi:hypothetical protein